MSDTAAAVPAIEKAGAAAPSCRGYPPAVLGLSSDILSFRLAFAWPVAKHVRVSLSLYSPSTHVRTLNWCDSGTMGYLQRRSMMNLPPRPPISTRIAASLETFVAGLPRERLLQEREVINVRSRALFTTFLHRLFLVCLLRELRACVWRT